MECRVINKTTAFFIACYCFSFVHLNIIRSKKFSGYYGLYINSQRFEQNQIKSSTKYEQKTVNLLWHSGGNRHPHISLYPRYNRQQPGRLAYDGYNVAAVSVGDVRKRRSARRENFTQLYPHEILLAGSTVLQNRKFL